MLHRLIVVTLLALAAAPAARACPDYSIAGAPHSATGEHLYDPRSYPVVAGGTYSLASCGNLPKTLAAAGYAAQPPDFSFTLTRMGDFELEIRAEGANGCDTLLLVNTPSGEWFFNDDEIDGILDPLIGFDEPGNGRYDIWVGTYEAATCNATLVIETFD